MFLLSPKGWSEYDGRKGRLSYNNSLSFLFLSPKGGVNMMVGKVDCPTVTACHFFFCPQRMEWIWWWRQVACPTVTTCSWIRSFLLRSASQKYMVGIVRWFSSNNNRSKFCHSPACAIPTVPSFNIRWAKFYRVGNHRANFADFIMDLQ
jgi:hypothetical protein